MLAEHGPDRVLVPPGHDRRRHRHAVAKRDRSGDADAGTVHLDGLAVGAQLADQVEHDGEDDIGTLSYVDRLADLLEHRQPSVGDRDVDGGRADVDPEKPQAGGESHDRRAATATRCREARRLDQPDLGEPIQLDRELRPGQVHRFAELGSAHRPVVSQHPEKLLLVRVLWSERHPPHADPPDLSSPD